MIEIKDIELFRDGNRLFHECSLTVFQGNKIAVIGANGCGKTTLFNLLLGNLHVDSGSISMPDKLVTAYVEQSTPHSSATALDFVIDGDREYRDLERDLAQAEKDNHGDKIAAVHDRLSSIGGYAIPARASELLYGLGFAPETHSNPVTTFSGGWRMRLNLAKALMCRSDLLLLDEPTNHLDIEAVIWLEKWLARYQGTLLLISHDRDFIDSVCNGIAHIHNCDITFYSGNYSAYEKQRAEKLALQEAMHKKQQGKIKHLESFITRFKAKATKSKQAQSRIKALEKMELIA
ncbi:MAG: ATP-binding cassette domain-containing protein, partial [Gammaproteobacteria bacterium]